MSITWTEGADSRAMLGPENMQQQNKAAFGTSDYVTGGYPVYPAAFGLSKIRALIPVGFSSTAAGTPGSVQWVAVQPAVLGPAASNPWYLKAGYFSAGAFNETASNTSFAGGTVDFLATGY
jgi:hypothetical protein